MRAFGARGFKMLMDQATQMFLQNRCTDVECFNQFAIHTQVEVILLVIQISETTGHACAKVYAGLTKH